jgi:glycosyltransferase involved in cell wall biosynthesis
MTEHHEAKRELYRKARALLYPVQFQEPFGLSMVEAMACGTPVIGNKLGSVPEIVTRDVGQVFADDEAPWANEWLCGYGKPPNLAFSPTTCRESAVWRFSRFSMAARYLAEYEAVIGGASWGGR